MDYRQYCSYALFPVMTFPLCVCFLSLGSHYACFAPQKDCFGQYVGCRMALYDARKISSYSLVLWGKCRKFAGELIKSKEKR